MAKNKIADLRDHLFETIEALKDPDKPMDLDRARAISTVAQTIINAAKIEVDMVKAVGGDAPNFFNVTPESRELPKLAEAPSRRLGIAGK
jgi:hypothetical protein